MILFASLHLVHKTIIPTPRVVVRTEHSNKVHSTTPGIWRMHHLRAFKKQTIWRKREENETQIFHWVFSSQWKKNRHIYKLVASQSSCGQLWSLFNVPLKVPMRPWTWRHRTAGLIQGAAGGYVGTQVATWTPDGRRKARGSTRSPHYLPHSPKAVCSSSWQFCIYLTLI